MQPEFTHDYCTPHISTWEKILMPYKGKAYVRFLEVGSFEGRSACWMLQNILTHPTATLTCIDPFFWLPESLACQRRYRLCTADALQERFENNIRSVGGEHKTTLLKGKSENILRAMTTESFDVIYIDGVHAARSVLTDLVLAWEILKLDGVMIIDDYQLQIFPDDARKNPRLGIDAFMDVFAGEYAVLHSDWQVIVQKIHLPSALWSEKRTDAAVQVNTPAQSAT
jgi:predicted O-methyltransferase YrrM